MGYRNYISQIKKDDLKKLLEAKMDWEETWELFHDLTEELHELGKAYDKPEGFEPKYDLSEDETEFIVIHLETLKEIIEQYADKHVAYLESLINPDEDYFADHHNPEDYVKAQIRHWKQHNSKFYNTIYNIDKDNSKLVNSWEFQYEIFDLVRIYKTFDSENYELVYRGY
jgi:hypothetical protein